MRYRLIRRMRRCYPDRRLTSFRRMMFLKAFYLLVSASSITHQTESGTGPKADDLFHDSNGIFSIYLYTNVSANKDGNIVVCPMSLNYALTAASLGAGGNSLRELRTVLNQPDDSSSIIYSYKSFAEKANVPNTLNLVTQMYIEKQMQVKNTFNNCLTHGFKANIEKVDFANNPDGSRNIINTYVDQETKHVINELLPPGSITYNTTFLVVNSLYFSSKWENLFSETDTKKKQFYSPDSEYHLVDMMFKAGENYRYLDNKEINAQIIEIPYQGEYSLLVILPKDKDGIAAVEKKIKSKAVSSSSSPFIDVFRDASWETVDVFLPKFNISQSFQLKRTLQTMGIKDMFNEKANFENLSDTKVQMSDVIHKTYFSVDETGTLAGTAAGPDSLPPSEARIVFNANHPFLYVIKLGATKTPMLIGKFMKP